MFLDIATVKVERDQVAQDLAWAPWLTAFSSNA